MRDAEPQLIAAVFDALLIVIELFESVDRQREVARAVDAVRDIRVAILRSVEVVEERNGSASADVEEEVREVRVRVISPARRQDAVLERESQHVAVEMHGLG